MFLDSEFKSRKSLLDKFSFFTPELDWVAELAEDTYDFVSSSTYSMIYYSWI